MATEGVEQVPGFVIHRELGRGAMGVVYLATEEALGRRVALKVLRAAGVDTAELRARFEREVKATARIQHPNVIPIHSTGEAHGHLWYAMPYVEGRSLDRLMRESPEGRLPHERAVRIVREVAHSLAAAHAAGVVHRDVKPGNVMLLTQPTPDVEASTPGRRLEASWIPSEPGLAHVVDRPLLVDFGLALDVGAAQLSRSGLLVGTPSYMAPEQFRGNPAEVGPAADQWSLGVLLYEGLTGRLPFPASDLATLARTVCEVPAVPPSRLDPTIDRELDVIVLKCLEKDPADRYPYCAALAEDLGRWLRETPIRAQPPGVFRRTRTWSRHHPVKATLALTVLLAGVVAGATAVVLGVAKSRRTVALAESARQSVAQGDLPEAALVYDLWVALEPESVEARDGRERVQALLRVREAERAFRDAQAEMEEVRRGEERFYALRLRADEGRNAQGGEGLGTKEARGSEPWWMREPAYRAGVEARREAESIEQHRARVTNLLAESLANVEAAHERAGETGARARASIREAAAAWHLLEWRRSLLVEDREGAEVHALAVKRLNPGPHEAELTGEGSLELRVPGSSSQAWLFRYERESDAVPRGGPRLVPLPFDLARRRAQVPAEYARAVAQRLEGEDPEAVQADTPSITEPFFRTETHVGTMTGLMARSRYERSRDDTAYPLVVTGSNALPLRSGSVEVPLPMGSYLVLLRAPGSADVRIPFAVRRQQRVTIEPGRLPGAGEVPAGFLPVAGRTPPAGSGEPGTVPRAEVAPFLAARYEVTYDEWWEFLNDPRTVEEVAAAPKGVIRFVPRLEGEPVVSPDERGVFPLPPVQLELPVASVSLFDVAGYLPVDVGESRPRDDQLQALARRLRHSETAGWGYLAWRTERSRARAKAAKEGGELLSDVVVVLRPDGTKEFRAMRFSLPTVEEWVWMAAGDDGRPFVYGEEREWLAFKGSRSRRSNPVPEPVGLFTDDESVFGARDLAGSVAEWTCDWKEVGGLFWVKGSSWGSQVPDDDRVVARASLSPDSADATVGLRVVVRETVPVD